MQYGHFDDANKEYVIDRPDTPRPWSNYIGSRNYGGIITNNAGGYSFARSSGEGRLLRMRFNSIPLDQPGRYFYLRDCDSGDYWSASWHPVGKPLDQYQSTCRFGTGYAVIDSHYAGVRMESTYFVPLGQEFEYWWLRVTNTGTTPRRLSLFTFAEFTSEWNMHNDLLNLQYSTNIAQASMVEGMVQASSCARLPEDPEHFGNRDQSRWWWFALCGVPVTGWDLDREAFIGVYNSFHNPAAVQSGRCSGSPGCRDNICAGLQSDIELAPGETRDVVALLGIGKADREGIKIRAEYGTANRAARELVALKQYWHGLLDTLTVKTPDTEFDHMVNVWNPYNALITFTWSRACSLVYTGNRRDGLGYRDSVQDVLGMVAADPQAARQRLELMITGQESTGGAMPEIDPLRHQPGKMPLTLPARYRSDDCLWLFNAVPAYVAETGDLSFYDLTLPYSDIGCDTVFAHLRRALEFNLTRVGSHGLPAGLSADWNDCLQLGYQGESVFVTFQVRFGLTVYAEIAARLGRADAQAWALAQRESLDTKIAAVCWDGDWFIWAIGADGSIYGSKSHPEGQVYLNTQAWAIISGAATDAQADHCLRTVRERLASPYGVRLCHPPFENTPVQVMRAVLFNPGNKENGGIFSHTQSWAVLAEALRGHGDQAFAYYRAFMPSAYNDRAELREIEPYVHCQSTVAPENPKAGASRIPWLSGTASWACYTAANWILGIRAEIDGLRIDPCIPTDWKGFSATRRFRGKLLDIEVSNPGHVSQGVASLIVNGSEISGNLIHEKLLTAHTRVTVVMGTSSFVGLRFATA